MSTVQEALNQANPNCLADACRLVKLGDVIAGMIPSTVAETGLTSSDTQTLATAGQVVTVESPAGTALTIVGEGVAPAAGEVAVAYDTDGVATLTFNAAVTEYTVSQTTIPAGLGDVLASDSGCAC